VTAFTINVQGVDRGFVFSILDMGTGYGHNVQLASGDCRNTASETEIALSFTTADNVVILPGDPIRTSSAYFSHKMRHVGMYAGNDRVIHLSGDKTANIRIEECSLKDFEAKHSNIHLHYVHPALKQIRTRNEALKEARKWVGKKWPGFDAIKNNCESFVTMCYTDQTNSHQGENCHKRHKLGGKIINFGIGLAQSGI